MSSARAAASSGVAWRKGKAKSTIDHAFLDEPPAGIVSHEPAIRGTRAAHRTHSRAALAADRGRPEDDRSMFNLPPIRCMHAQRATPPDHTILSTV
jgi:hypothetical protein